LPTIKDILTEKEHLEIGRLRLRMLNATSFSEVDYYYEKILEIIKQAQKRYLQEKKVFTG
jgi:hypothetical protein